MDLKQAKKISKALSDDTRLQILQEIKRRSNCLHCVDIYEIINLSQPSISHHVKQLLEADLIIQEKTGRKVLYKVNREVFNEYINFLEGLKSF